MQGEKGERWRALCELAAKEQDHEKLLDLIRQINDLLSEKEHRLAHARKQDISPDTALRANTTKGV
jgi:hypothetical protein